VVWWRRRRPAAGIPYPDLDVIAAADPGPRLRRHLPLALALLALTGLVFALARPAVDRQVPRERATIMLAVDVSGSMAATDVDPYRLRAAQDAALTFIDEVPRQYQVGLVSFSGQANLLVSPTTDRDAMRRAIETLTPDGATAVGEAIESSLEAIRSVQPTTDGDGRLEAARIVVLSDGATTVGIAPSVAAEDAKEAGVPVYTVALGTDDGILSNGQPVPPDPVGLQEVADITGGEAYESTDAESVSAVYERLGSFIGTESVRSEVTAWPAGIAVILLVLAGVAAWRVSPRLS
jgi:Ca-activated chloride channel family protein